MTLKCNMPLEKFKQMLASVKSENPRFNISQFEKYYYPDSGIQWCMLVDGARCLAAAAIMEDGPKSGWWYLNEIQCLVKGFGSKMLKALLKHYKNVWLMADPTANSTLIDYYRRPEFNLEEHVIPAAMSFYNVDTYVFSTKGLSESIWMDWLAKRFGSEKQELQKLNEDGEHSTDYWGKFLNTVLRAYQNRYGLDLYHMKAVVDERPVYNNGERCYEFYSDECAGDWTKLGWIRINPDLKSVMKRYDVVADETEFAKNIIAHELAHEVWNNIATDDFKHEMLDAAKKSNFTTKYLQTIENPSKLPEETFCEWLAKEVAPISNDAIKSIDFPEEEIPALSAQNHIVTHRVSDDFGKFCIGDVVKTPWERTYKVVNSNAVDNIDYSPYADSLSPQQYEFLKGFDKISILELDAMYEPPYTLEQIKAHYPENVYLTLANDPVHRWRAETGIELIHKEPDEAEQDRIWANWQLMSDEMKEMSDIKSLELFGCTNEQHYNFLKTEEYEEEC